MREGEAPSIIVTGVQRMTGLEGPLELTPGVDRYGIENIFFALSAEIPVIAVYGSSALALKQEYDHLPWQTSSSQVVFIDMGDVDGLLTYCRLALTGVSTLEL